MRHTGLLALFILSMYSAASLAQNTARPSTVPASCPLTKADHAFVPPGHPTIPRNEFWFGTDKLWTRLPASANWSLSHSTPDDPSFRQKLFFWSQGYDARRNPQPDLTLSGKRLDSSAPPLQTDDHADGSWTQDDQFIVTGINFPTTGCWRVTASYANQQLTFVVWIGQ